MNLVLYHGVRAPHARWRAEVVACRRAERTGSDRSESGANQHPDGDLGAGRPRYWTWVALIRRAFDLDVPRCPRCSGRRQHIATIDDPSAVVTARLAQRALPVASAPGAAGV